MASGEQFPCGFGFGFRFSVFDFHFTFSAFRFPLSLPIRPPAVGHGPPVGAQFNGCAGTFKEMQWGNFSRHLSLSKIIAPNRSCISTRKRKRLAIKKRCRIWLQLERGKDTAQMPTATATATATKRDLHNLRGKTLGKTSISFTFLLHSVCLAASWHEAFATFSCSFSRFPSTSIFLSSGCDCCCCISCCCSCWWKRLAALD